MNIQAIINAFTSPVPAPAADATLCTVAQSTLSERQERAESTIKTVRMRLLRTVQNDGLWMILRDPTPEVAGTAVCLISGDVIEIGIEAMKEFEAYSRIYKVEAARFDAIQMPAIEREINSEGEVVFFDEEIESTYTRWTNASGVQLVTLPEADLWLLGYEPKVITSFGGNVQRESAWGMGKPSASFGEQFECKQRVLRRTFSPAEVFIRVSLLEIG